MKPLKLPPKVKNDKDKDEEFINFTIPDDPFQAICEQETAKRAIEISLAGEYPLCLYGPLGQGKTSLLNAYRELYKKIYRRKVPNDFLFDIDGYPKERTAVLYAKIEKLSYSGIHKGFNGVTERVILKKINSRLQITEYHITPDFWDILGQSYSRDELTPKQVFTALKVSRTIANLDRSEIITRKIFKEALSLVTFPFEINP